MRPWTDRTPRPPKPRAVTATERGWVAWWRKNGVTTAYLTDAAKVAKLLPDGLTAAQKRDSARAIVAHVTARGAAVPPPSTPITPITRGDDDDLIDQEDDDTEDPEDQEMPTTQRRADESEEDEDPKERMKKNAQKAFEKGLGIHPSNTAPAKGAPPPPEPGPSNVSSPPPKPTGRPNKVDREPRPTLPGVKSQRAGGDPKQLRAALKAAPPALRAAWERHFPGAGK